MKRVGYWWVPEYENKPRILRNIAKEKWQCALALERALAHVKDFGLALDIGTWIGDSTKILAKKFASVIGFEAAPAVYDCCVLNMHEHCPTDNVSVHNMALSDRSGAGHLLNRNSTFAGWVVTKDEHRKDPNLIDVSTQRLDAYDFYGVGFVKIDVDGHEGFLLKGARKFFKRNSPVILIEHETKTRKLQHASMPPAPVILQDLGYRMVAQASRMDYIYVRDTP